MSDASFQVEVVAVEERIYSGDATFLIAQTTEGELGILHGHEPLLGQLIENGFVLIEQTDGVRKVAAVQGGFLSVTGESVTVLAETAEWADEVNADAEKAVLETAEEGSAEFLRAESRLKAVEQLGASK